MHLAETLGYLVLTSYTDGKPTYLQAIMEAHKLACRGVERKLLPDLAALSAARSISRAPAAARAASAPAHRRMQCMCW